LRAHRWCSNGEVAGEIPSPLHPNAARRHNRHGHGRAWRWGQVQWQTSRSTPPSEHHFTAGAMALKFNRPPGRFGQWPRRRKVGQESRSSSLGVLPLLESSSEPRPSGGDDAQVHPSGIERVEVEAHHRDRGERLRRSCAPRIPLLPTPVITQFGPLVGTRAPADPRCRKSTWLCLQPAWPAGGDPPRLPRSRAARQCRHPGPTSSAGAL